MEEIINIYTDGSSLENPGPEDTDNSRVEKENYIKEYSKD